MGKIVGRSLKWQGRRVWFAPLFLAYLSLCRAGLPPLSSLSRGSQSAASAREFGRRLRGALRGRRRAAAARINMCETHSKRTSGKLSTVLYSGPRTSSPLSSHTNRATPLRFSLHSNTHNFT